jgi:hypothetical protein
MTCERPPAAFFLDARPIGLALRGRLSPSRRGRIGIVETKPILPLIEGETRA